MRLSSPGCCSRPLWLSCVVLCTVEASSHHRGVGSRYERWSRTWRRLLGVKTVRLRRREAPCETLLSLERVDCSHPSCLCFVKQPDGGRAAVTQSLLFWQGLWCGLVYCGPKDEAPVFSQ